MAGILLEAHHFGTDGIDALAISAPKDKDRVLTTNVSLEMAQRIVQKNFTAAFKDLDRLRSFYQTTINESFPE